MDDHRAPLLAALDTLATAGQAADAALTAEERRHAALEAPSRDEQALQTLGAISRELWAAHAATQRALRVIAQLRRVQAQASATP